MGIDYAQLGIEPVSEEMPAGDDIRYEDEFENLQDEIDKLSSPSLRESFSWAKVVEYAAEILENQSKDILAAAYLCVGLIHINGSEGFDQAVKIFDDLIATFWDDLFPSKKRMNGRATAIKWWVDRTLLALEDDFNLNVEPETYTAITKRLDRIQTFLEESHEFDISAFGLIRAVENMDPAKTAPETTEAVPDSLPDIEITSPENAARQLSPVFKQLKQASKIVRENDTTNPQSYKWLRFGLWESVKALPVATDNITKLAPPKEQIFTHLETLKNDEEWEKLLLAAESALNNPANIFALDINWYSAQALMNLKEEYRPAHTIVCQETFMFINRLPGVEELMFSNETPFASEETKQWLKSLNSAEPGRAENNLSNLNENEEDYVTETIKQARTVLRKRNGKINSANLLHQAINKASSKKDSFILRLELVRILAAKRSEKASIGHLNQILDDILEFHLDIWEPEIALNGLKATYKIFKTQKDIKYKQKAEEVYNMIAGISTVDAMGL